jgi:hypothetical protein
MKNKVLTIPVVWWLAGASFGVCVGMLNYEDRSTHRVRLEDSSWLAFLGWAVGAVIGCLVNVVQSRAPRLRSVVTANSVGTLGAGIGGIVGWLAGDISWRPGAEHDRLVQTGMTISGLCGFVVGALSGAVSGRRRRRVVDEDDLPRFLRATSRSEGAEKKSNDENRICLPDQGTTQSSPEDRRKGASDSYTKWKADGIDRWRSG